MKRIAMVGYHHDWAKPGSITVVIHVKNLWTKILIATLIIMVLLPYKWEGITGDKINVLIKKIWKIWSLVKTIYRNMTFKPSGTHSLLMYTHQRSIIGFYV